MTFTAVLLISSTSLVTMPSPTHSLSRLQSASAGTHRAAPSNTMQEPSVVHFFSRTSEKESRCGVTTAENELSFLLPGRNSFAVLQLRLPELFYPKPDE